MAKPPADDILLHPVRMRIVVALAGRKLTAGQLRAELADVPQATLYQHLGRLTRAGTLRVVEERPVRGTLERVYAINESSPALHPFDPGQLAPEQLRQYLATFLAALLADGSRYLRAEDINPMRDGFGFRQVIFNLSDEDLRAMLRALSATLMPYLAQKPAPGRRRLLFSTVLIPQASAKDEEPGAPPEAPPEAPPDETTDA